MSQQNWIKLEIHNYQRAYLIFIGWELCLSCKKNKYQFALANRFLCCTHKQVEETSWNKTKLMDNKISTTNFKTTIDFKTNWKL